MTPAAPEHSTNPVPISKRRWIGPLALFVATGCASTPTTTAERASTPAGAVFESPTYGYSWRLPPEWSFVREELRNAQHPSAIELITATREGDHPLAARVVVRSRLSVVAGWNPERGDDDAELERLGVDSLENKGALVSGSRRVDMLGARAVETNGFVDAERISVRLLYRGRRVFQFVCVGAGEGSEWPCASAFTGFKIDEMAEPTVEPQEPRVLHLRDARFGLEFDAPDDSWLAIGPSTAMNGAQQVWIWHNAGRQIDVQVADLSSLPVVPDAAFFVARMMKHLEEKGATVTLRKSELSGMPCHHVEVTRQDGYEDVFMLNHDSINYGLLVAQPKRDSMLIERVKRGFRLTVRQTTPIAN
jgi:hypothetical protein